MLVDSDFYKCIGTVDFIVRTLLLYSNNLNTLHNITTIMAVVMHEIPKGSGRFYHYR